MKSYNSKLIILIMISLFLLTGCSKEGNNKLNNKQQDLGIPVETKRLSRRDFTNQLVVTGTIEGEKEVNIFAERTAKVKELKVDEGDRVKKGMIIAKLEDEQLKANLKQAQANLEIVKSEWQKIKEGARPEEIKKVKAKLSRSKANYKQAKSEYKRGKQLHEANVITQQKFDSIVKNLKVAEANLKVAEENWALVQQGARSEDRKIVKEKYKRAEAEVEIIKSQLQDTVITAPSSGVISDLFLEEGELANPKQALAYLIQQQRVVLKADVSTKDLNKLSIDKKVRLKVSSYPRKTFLGKVVRIGEKVDKRTRTIEVEVVIDNSKGQLKSGMFAKGNIITDRFEDVIIITEDVLVGKNNNSVYVVNQGRVEKREIEVEKINSTTYIVKQGLEVGEEIITSNLSRISSGDKIYIEEQESGK